MKERKKTSETCELDT